MMLKPSLTQILKKDESYYSLVVAVAKRAREIAEESEKEKNWLNWSAPTHTQLLFGGGCTLLGCPDRHMWDYDHPTCAH